MRKVVAWSLTALLLLPTAASAAGPELKTEHDKTLYALGLAVAGNLAGFNMTEAELEQFKVGLTDGVLHRTPKIDLQAYRPKLQELQQERLAAMAEGERKAGRAFLDKAAAEKGAKRTKSGLVIQTIREGAGTSPKPSDSVKVHYTGTLIDGTVFDSSVQRGEPATFALGKVIPCWTEGLQLMKVGGKSRLACPADLAYGDRGAPPRIKPGATLVFEVELLEIMK